MSQDTHDPIAQLRDELAGVAVSREFAGRVRERLSDESSVIGPLRAELADLNVSPEFAVRVRQDIEAGAGRRAAWGFNWRWAIPAAGLAAALVVVAVWPRTMDVMSAPSNTIAIVRPPVVEPPVVPPVVTSSTSRVAPPVAVVSRVPRPQEAGSSDPAQPRDPFLQVITDQPELLRTLWVRVESGVSVDATEPTGNYEAPKLEVPKVEVSPVSLFVVPNLRAPIGVSPFILRIAADSAERSSK